MGERRPGVPRRPGGRPRRAGGWALAATGVVVVVLATLTPAAGVTIGPSLVPGAGTRQVWRLTGGDLGVVVRMLALNVALFAPLGAGVALLRRRRPVALAAAAGAALSVAVEAAQWALPVERSTDVDDVLANTAGAALAALAVAALRRSG